MHASIPIVLLALASVVPAQELRHDDGKKDDKRSVAGRGHQVLFERPKDPWYATAVRIHGSRYGGGYDPFLTVARVTVCDAELEPLREAFMAYDEFGGSPGWVDVPLLPCRVPEKFRVVVEFFPTQRKGIYVSIDSDRSGHSGFATPGRSQGALGSGEWMIRVVGKTKPPAVDVADETATEVLAHGKGPSVSKRSTAGAGHAVRFTRPAKKPLLTGVSLFGDRYGGGYRADQTFFHVFLCDKRMKVIARWAHPYSVFDVGEPGWKDIELPPVRVPKQFHVLVHFDPTAKRGVYLGMWKERRASSFSAVPDGKSEKIKKLGWMVRATVAASKGKGAAPVRVRKKKTTPAAAKLPPPRTDESEHFVLKRDGMPDAHAKCLLAVMEAAHTALTTRFGFKRVSAIPGKKIHLSVTIRKGLATTLFTSPSSPRNSLIVYRGSPESLRPPTKGGPHHVYGWCHELGHVLLGWDKTSRHKWAHYLGSMLLDDVKKAVGDKAWPVAYDYAKLEGIPRFEREIADAESDRRTDQGTARLFYEVGKQFGVDVWGPAFRWIQKKRKGKRFHAVRLYTLNDLRDALIALGKDKSRVNALFQ